jgi:phosphoglucosamine mutase
MTALPPLEFGTDGLRGRAGQPPLDPATMRAVGAALGVLLQRSGGEQKRVLVGNDGRESAVWLLEALAQGLAAAEVSISDLGLCTTPALAVLTHHHPFDAGIMISASHNPAHDNGIKIFAADGTKLDAEAEQEIARLAMALQPAELRPARIKDRSDLLRDYEHRLANAFPHLDLTGRKICLDAAHGGGSELAAHVLRAFGAEVVEIGGEPDGFNINDGVGALHPEGLAQAVLDHGAALGIALDGDGDRGIFVDDQGSIRDGDDVLALFGTALHRAGRLPRGMLAATVMSNLGLHRALGAAGVQIHSTPVGDRHVFLAMRQHGIALGGEQSGHILFADHELVGDGLYTGLRLLDWLGRDPSLAAHFAASGFRRFPQHLENVAVRSKPELASLPAVAAAIAAVTQELGDNGRLLVRYSGTEPKCRVMVEAASAEQTHRLAAQVADAIRAAIGA